MKDNVKALTVGGVKPTEETVKDGSYVVQRPFVLVTKHGAEHCAPRPRPSIELRNLRGRGGAEIRAAGAGPVA